MTRGIMKLHVNKDVGQMEKVYYGMKNPSNRTDLCHCQLSAFLVLILMAFYLSQCRRCRMLFITCRKLAKSGAVIVRYNEVLTAATSHNHVKTRQTRDLNNNCVSNVKDMYIKLINNGVRFIIYMQIKRVNNVCVCV